MTYISVDINMSEIDTDDLIDELQRRLERDRDKLIRTKSYERFKVVYDDFSSLLERHEAINIGDGTLEGDLKLKHIQTVFNKYSLSQLEQLIP